MNREAWKKWAATLKRNTYALYLASRDQRVSLLAKFIIGIVVAYALSPIDLVPDFIPVIGYIDDLLLLPMGIWLAIRLIPENVWRECQVRAKEEFFKLPSNRRAAVIIVLIWLLLLIGFIMSIWSFVSRATST